MEALVLVDEAVLELQDIPIPERPGHDWVLVEVAFAGICQSDQERAFTGGAYHYPLIMGHELSGVVAESARGGALAAGTRVAVMPLLPCRRCRACARQDFAKCADYDYLGSRRDGGFARYVWAPEANLYVLPERLDLKTAALLEPCAVALHGASLFERAGAEGALVIGDGPLGVMLAQWLRLRGCARVVVSGRHREKLERCVALGFETILAGEEDVAAAFEARFDGHRPPLVAEAVGREETILQALRCGGNGCQVVLLGNPRSDVTIPRDLFSSLLRREVVIRGAWNSRVAPPEQDQWRQALAELGRAMEVESLISHVYPLEQGVEVFQRLRARAEPFSKVLLEIGAAGPARARDPRGR